MKYIIVFLFLFYSQSCKTQKQTRINIVKEAIKAFKLNDLKTLYKVIDTSYCNSIYSEEGFQRRIQVIHTDMDKCTFTFSDSNIEIVESQTNTEQYIVQLCSLKNGDGTTLMRKLILSFANYDADQKIKFVEIKNEGNYLENFDPGPPFKPGKG